MISSGQRQSNAGDSFNSLCLYWLPPFSVSCFSILVRWPNRGIELGGELREVSWGDWTGGSNMVSLYLLSRLLPWGFFFVGEELSGKKNSGFTGLMQV